ncbi:MAG: glycosyltransferase [Alphaproteobacteria bacterium]|nr:glycosyltransferase [Alphaproteobacteria bacterium]MBL6940400.1 glycosyltransferase [Alphaproteobacteria bacterium]MBL7099767.1 glycosyltransferase [Alphaproteobacteria bacterium]
MAGLSILLQCLLACVLVVIAALSIQLVVLCFFRLYRQPPRVRLPVLPDEALPRVLVQLPVCDEGPLAVRVAAAAARLDWPSDKLEIQVLDDGRRGDPSEVVRNVMSVVPEGVNLKVMRRNDRSGFKAGNLAFGLLHSDAPYVAIFDADFVPPTDFLRRTVPALIGDQRLAYAQARWGHANRTKNWLTRAQGMLLDAHFSVEQEARFRGGLPMSFNGTAGVWSRKAIDDGGGWTGDTLTEDLDLSMRCAMKGWRTVLMGNVEVPGELPETAAAWRAQQARWTKGHAQTARKLLPPIWTSDMPLWKKVAMTLQMIQFAFYTLAFLSAVISLTLMYMGVTYIASVSALGLSVSALGLIASTSYLYLGQVMLGRERLPCIARSIGLAVVFPSGLILANTRATYEAFFSTAMHFHRTLRPGERYSGGWRGTPELVAGLLLPVFAFAEQAWSAPFFFFAVTGLVSIGAMGLSGSTTPVPGAEIRPGE